MAIAIQAPGRLLLRFRGCIIPGSITGSITSSTTSTLLPRRLLSTFPGSGTLSQLQRWSTSPSSPSLASSTYYYTSTAPASQSRTMATTTAATLSSSKGQPEPQWQSQLSRMKYAAGEDVPQLESNARSLVEDDGWVVDEEGMGVKKTFYFKGYFKAVSFLNFIAAESASKKHHAIMTLRIGSVDVYWTTHQPRGFTHKDVYMARHCDKGAELMGSVEPDQGQKCTPAEPPK